MQIEQRLNETIETISQLIFEQDTKINDDNAYSHTKTVLTKVLQDLKKIKNRNDGPKRITAKKHRKNY